MHNYIFNIERYNIMDIPVFLEIPWYMNTLIIQYYDNYRIATAQITIWYHHDTIIVFINVTFPVLHC